ncbi:hypothetical protein ASF09_07690 [Sphingomonas sp. Leaf242]|nr:hypothetical protein ASF09_07690 [Sphingomonas sp. Leaf242]
MPDQIVGDRADPAFGLHMSPVAPYFFFLMANRSAADRSSNISSNAWSNSTLSRSAVFAVRPSYRICSVAPSATASISL